MWWPPGQDPALGQGSRALHRQKTAAGDVNLGLSIRSRRAELPRSLSTWGLGGLRDSWILRRSRLCALSIMESNCRIPLTAARRPEIARAAGKRKAFEIRRRRKFGWGGAGGRVYISARQRSYWPLVIARAHLCRFHGARTTQERFSGGVGASMLQFRKAIQKPPGGAPRNPGCACIIYSVMLAICIKL